MYCAAWAVAGITLFGYGIAPSMPVVLAIGFFAGLASPAAAVTLRARLSEFERQDRLRLITVDQTVIRTAGTIGMLTLPMAVDAAPGTAFAGAGMLLVAAAGTTAVVGWRLAGGSEPAEMQPVAQRAP